MKIKLYALLHNDIQNWYTLDYAGDEVSEGNALDILSQAKDKFKIAGKTFIMMTLDDTFFITRLNKTKSEPDKKWKVYKLEKGTNDTVSEQEDVIVGDGDNPDILEEVEHEQD